MKLLMPLDLLREQVGLPDLLVRAVGLAELLGGLGQVLPRLLHVCPGLTPLAVVELARLVLDARLLTLVTDGNLALALLPLVMSLLAAGVVCGHWRLTPVGERARPPALDTPAAA